MAGRHHGPAHHRRLPIRPPIRSSAALRLLLIGSAPGSVARGISQGPTKARPFEGMCKTQASGPNSHRTAPVDAWTRGPGPTGGEPGVLLSCGHRKIQERTQDPRHSTPPHPTPPLDPEPEYNTAVRGQEKRPSQPQAHRHTNKHEPLHGHRHTELTRWNTALPQAFANSCHTPRYQEPFPGRPCSKSTAPLAWPRPHFTHLGSKEQDWLRLPCPCRLKQAHAFP